MIRRATSQDLLARARLIYDDPDLPFAAMAGREGWRSGFVSGAEWMRLAMSLVRRVEIPRTYAPFHVLGIVKYGLCSLAAVIYLLLICGVRWDPLIIGGVIVFYAVEAKM